MKVIVAGSRHITSRKIVALAMQASKLEISELVCGLAPGVDSVARELADEALVPIKDFPADWDKYPKAAGHIRNKEMGNYADALVAVWDGQSKGTQHMIQYMCDLNKPVYIYLYKE